MATDWRESALAAERESLVELRRAMATDWRESALAAERESLVELRRAMATDWRESALAAERESLAELRQMSARIPELLDLQSVLGEMSQIGNNVEPSAGKVVSSDEADSESPSLDHLKLQLLLVMIVLWVRVTPYLSPGDMAQFVKWWVDFVAALLASS